MAFTPYIDIYPEKGLFRILFEIFLREGMEGGGEGCFVRRGFLGEIFYRHKVVGKYTYFMCTKIGGGI